MPKERVAYQKSHENIIAIRNIISSIFGTKNPTLKAILFAMGVFIFAGWFPELLSSLFGLIFKNNEFTIISIKIAFLIFIISYFIYEIKKSNLFLSPLKVFVNEEPAPVKVLLIFLSKLNDKDLNTVKNLCEKDISNFQDEYKANKLYTCSWHMPITAITHHLSSLEKVYVVASEQTIKSYKIFETLINKYFNKNDNFVALWPEESQGQDFSNIEQIFDIISNFYIKMNNYNESDVLVDITGGLVITSVAASLAALATGRPVQYVSTMDMKVRTYELVYSQE